MSDQNPRIPKPHGSMTTPKVDELALRGKRADAELTPSGKKPGPLSAMYKRPPHIPQPGEIPPKSYYKQIGPLKVKTDKNGRRVKHADYLCTQCNSSVRTLRPCDVNSGRRKSCGCNRSQDQAVRMATFYDKIQKLKDDLDEARQMLAKYRKTEEYKPRNRRRKSN